MNKKLPNFLIVGAAKSGTTSLDEYLGQHKDIFMPTPKEPKFLTYDAGIRGYTGPGDQDAELEIVKTFAEYKKLYLNSEHAFRGDSSVDLLYYYDVSIPKIKQYLSDPKIIIVLRNPVDRAYSSFLHLKRDLREKLTFKEALEAENKRIDAGYEFIWHYLQVGKYAKQVKAYQNNFSNVKVVVFDELIHNTSDTVKQILKFLGADEFQFIDVQKVSNVSGIPKNDFLQKILYNRILRKLYRVYFKGGTIGNIIMGLREKVIQKNLEKEKMDPEIRKQLQNLYYEDIKELEQIINRDLSHWLA